MANKRASADHLLATSPVCAALRSDAVAAGYITSEFGVEIADFVRFYGRIKNLLRVGLLSGRDTSRGKASALTPEQYRRLKWAALLTSCDIPPATIVRMMRDESDTRLAQDTLTFSLGSEMHTHVISITATLPKAPCSEVASFVAVQNAEPARAFGSSQLDERFYAELCGEAPNHEANTRLENYSGAVASLREVAS